MTDRPEYSPARLRGHRERLLLSRALLGSTVGVTADAIKSYEYGITTPSLKVFLALTHALGITPNDLIRRSPNDERERQEGFDWPLLFEMTEVRHDPDEPPPFG